MPTHNHIRCTVHTEDGALQEYQDDDRSLSPSTRSVYIEVKSSVPFFFVCEVLQDYHYTRGDRMGFKVFIDGKRMFTPRLACITHPMVEIKGARSIERNGRQFIQPFEFSEISLGMSRELKVGLYYVLS